VGPQQWGYHDVARAKVNAHQRRSAGGGGRAFSEKTELFAIMV
jgi:hypothetical protein